MKSPNLKALFLLSPILFCLTACKKNLSNSSAMRSDSSLIENARAYFQTSIQQSMPAAATGNPRLDAAKAPYWPSAYSVNLSKGPAVIVPVFYQKDLVVTTSFNPNQTFPLNQLAKLVIYRDSSGYQMELVTSFPDTASKGINSGDFSGIIFAETWQGQPINTYKVSGGQVLVRQALSATQSNAPEQLIPDASKTPTTIIETCYTISGYNYSPSDPEDGVAWTESAGCDIEYKSDGGSGGGPSGAELGALAGGVGVRKPVSPTITIPIGNNIIGNIADYMRCFSNYGGSDHTYQVMLCVSQPVPGTRAPWTLTAGGPGGSTAASNPINAGHTFLVLSEIFSDHSIVRNVGFYPQTIVDPVSPTSQGQLNNDANHTYNISLTITVDDGQFFNILNYINQGNNPGFLYNLSTNNCSSFGLHALEAGGIVVPATVGSWAGGGMGYDPGDLGEDIRGMQLPSNMSRNTVSNSHPNLGTCD
jgi:hypothetical protein